MSLPYLLLSNYFGMYIAGLALFCVSSVILDRKLSAKKMLLSLLGYALVYSISASLLSFQDIQKSGAVGTVSFVLMMVPDLIINVGYLKYLFRDLKNMQVLFVLAVVSPIYYVGVTAATYTLVKMLPVLPEVQVLMRVLYLLLSFGYTLLLVKILQRTKILIYLRRLVEYPKIYIPLGVIYFCLNIVNVVFAGIGDFSWLTALGLVIIIGVAALVREFTIQGTLKASQAMVLQQQNYVTRLERIQKELRLVQHDYKNMVAGLYAQASEGDAGAVKDYIENKLFRIDASVQEDIRQMNQLTQVQVPELKGLVLTKIMLAEQQHVSVRLEVMNPVEEVFLQIEDMIRCVGILMDNAIEEAVKHDGGEVVLLMLQEEGQFTVVVKNPIAHQPDMTRIWQEGYSTKGENRGLGLTSYQRILHKYGNIFKETKIEDQTFIQILGAMKEA